MRVVNFKLREVTLKMIVIIYVYLYLLFVPLIMDSVCFRCTCNHVFLYVLDVPVSR